MMSLLPRLTRGSAGRRDDGFVAIEFVAAMGFLLLPIALLVMIFPTWAERQAMGRTAAREAARTYVITGDAAASQAVVDNLTSNYKLENGDVRLRLEGDPTVRGGEVTAIVTIQVPATNIGMLNLDSNAFSFTERHTEVVDCYRSNLSSEAAGTC